MSKRNSFLLYKDWIVPITKLKDEDAGKLFKSILNYVNDSEYIIQKPYSDLFESIKEQIVFEWLKRNPKTGKYHWNYQGGITPENKIIRNSEAIKWWRVSVFERDEYTCQKCRKKGGELHAHHIKRFSLFPELRTNLSNGITLCKECHINEHKKLKNG